MAHTNEEFAALLRAPEEGDEGAAQERHAPPVQEDVIPEDAWLSDEEFRALTPGQRTAYNARLRQAKEQERALREERERHAAEMAEMRELVKSSVSARAPEKTAESENPLAGYSDEELIQWQQDAAVARAKAELAPDDEVARENATKASPQRMLMVQRELARRQIESITESKLKPLQERTEAQERNARAVTSLQNTIREKFGAQVLLDDNPEGPRVRALKRVEETKRLVGAGNLSPEAEGALIIQALEVEMAEERNRGASRRDPAMLRRLELEGAQRQASSLSSERSAAHARGDKKAVFKMDLNSFMDEMDLP